MSVHPKDFFGSLRPTVIIGPGLIGGSLALALREKVPGAPLRVWARERSLQKTREALGGGVFVTSDVREAVEGSGLVVFCCPIGAMQGLAREMRGVLGDALVTDAGSVKGPVVEVLEPILGERFVGAHPMAGGERGGIEAASGNLFEGATCIITPGAETAAEAIAGIRSFWEGVGCRVLSMSASQHDRLVALASHLPHAVASALTLAVGSGDAQGGSGPLDVIGRGFRDSTRIAAGPAGLWAEIFLANRAEVLLALRDFLGACHEFEAMLRDANAAELEDFLSRAGMIRRRLG